MDPIIEYRIERAQRKSVQFRICPDGTLLVKVPLRYPEAEIEALIRRHTKWIERHREIMKKRTEREQTYAHTPEQIEELYRQAEAYIPSRVEYYAAMMGVTPTGVKITGAQKRFGSCSGKNSLCFSYRIMMYPPEAIDYVIVHELAHIRCHDHSPAFYEVVASILPDHLQHEAMLKEKL